MIYIKKHKEVLAACDENVTGKYEKFYKGSLVNKKTFHKEISNAQNINLLGRKTIQWASEITELETTDIDGVPHAIILKV